MGGPPRWAFRVVAVLAAPLTVTVAAVFPPVTVALLAYGAWVRRPDEAALDMLASDRTGPAER